ncbi:hypothetical protein PSQ19_12745 [Devosia algicola]|uniref:Uncharacterized protein n=1 Tax=Devosia algicola TaxID=3026418 RepID=A0ABY7YU70_9HYPH|nr:hypothetical protein [Devosia algicola]WDR04395.1 hypothetical protein PSQ19_12745 [Devosia algicola]
MSHDLSSAKKRSRLYERNWRHVDADHLTTEEADLIEDLTQEFGHGYRMFA